MASFYAELQVAGHTHPLRHCSYEFTQATDPRGRVAAKVRHGLVHLVLDVPNDDFLIDWANTPFRPLPGRIVFFDAKGRAARETLSWEAGNCVGYQENFTSGSIDVGAYVCLVTITAPKLVLTPGEPGQFVPPAPGEHGPPQIALLGVPTPLATLTAEEVAVALAPEVLPLAPLLLPVAGMAAAVLALILATTTPAQAPGLPHLPLVSPDELRLRLLAAKHAAGTLTADEEAELIDLLAKVKGIRVQKLSDLEASPFFHEFNGHRINLHSCPVVVPPSSSITEQSKPGYDQVKFKWNDGAYGYEARWHTKTPGAPVTQGDTWVVTRTTAGTAQGQRKVQHILTGPNQWTPSHQWQSAVSANQSKTATSAQKHLLNAGHWPAHK